MYQLILDSYEHMFTREKKKELLRISLGLAIAGSAIVNPTTTIFSIRVADDKNHFYPVGKQPSASTRIQGVRERGTSSG